jgi:Ribulose-5-phosphate 4-epimerase and related epimerases and aldolases
MILRNHGLLSVGQTVGQAFSNIYRLEKACQTQLLAMACNAEMSVPPQEIIARSNAQLAVSPTPDAQGRKASTRFDGMAGVETDARPARRLLQELTPRLGTRLAAYWRHRNHTRMSQQGAAQRGTW